MKNFLKYTLQKTFGLPNYLYLFARYVIKKLPYDKNEKDFLKFIHLIEDGKHVLDIGANIGVMTYYFSKMLPGSTIHSFEPIPENMDVLKKIEDRYGLSNVKTYSFALGNENKEACMIMPESKKVFFHGLSHVNDKMDDNSGHTYRVQMKRLDDLEKFGNLQIAAIKLDVEEYEYQVLLGAGNLINKNRPVIYCELWESENRTKTFELIDKLNYKTYINQTGNLAEYRNQKGYQNFFFIPEEKSHKLKL